MPEPADDPVYRNSLREALVALGAWVVCACYTLTYCSFAYNIKAAEAKVVWGVPRWILLGVLLPWMIANLFAWWYCFYCVRDDDLSGRPEKLDSRD